VRKNRDKRHRKESAGNDMIYNFGDDEGDLIGIDAAADSADIRPVRRLKKTEVIIIREATPTFLYMDDIISFRKLLIALGPAPRP
jgi:hypothetical protein